jgi:hypothetical protein
MLSRLFQLVESHYTKLIVGSGVIGANVGGYYCAKQGDRYIYGAIGGGLAGAWFGSMSPVLIPMLFLTLPGYLLSKRHSSQQVSLLKEETPKVQKDLV